MITYPGRWFIRLVLCPLLLFAVTASAGAGDITGTKAEGEVFSVIDGDTLVLETRERVRLLGLDAPERGEVLSGEARNRLLELTHGKKLELETCSEKDQYGRILAVVRTEGRNVNMVLLEEGLAVPMIIPPCGKMVIFDALGAAETAIEGRKGIYAREDYEIVGHEQAGDYIGKHAVIRGKIAALHKGEKAWHLNFGDDWTTDFTAVIFRQGRSRFEDLGVDPEDLVGCEVLVIGEVKSYNGPEIIVRGPEQIIRTD